MLLETNSHVFSVTQPIPPWFAQSALPWWTIPARPASPAGGWNLIPLILSKYRDARTFCGPGKADGRPRGKTLPVAQCTCLSSLVARLVYTGHLLKPGLISTLLCFHVQR